MTCEEFEEIAGAYALDALTPGEHQAAQAHLATCARCRSLRQELSEVVALLPLAVPQVEPPASLGEQIRAALPHGSTTLAPLSERPPHMRRRRWIPRLLAVAAIVMFSLLSGITAWNISLTHQVTSLQQELAHVPAHQPAALGVVTYRVEGITPAQGVSGELLYLPQQNLTVLMLSGLSRLQGLHVYQGWLLHLKGKEVSAVTSIGLLNQIQDTASVSFLGNVTGYDAVAVSVEPGPMATPKAPKGKLVALGTLKRSATSTYLLTLSEATNDE